MSSGRTKDKEEKTSGREVSDKKESLSQEGDPKNKSTDPDFDGELIARLVSEKDLEAYSMEEKEAARLLFARPCDFILGVPSFKFLPPITLPEVAFAGRSNVGKSSLINALVNQKGLARASNTPGRTQHLNYFNLGERAFLVDLPGYGYASAPKKTVDAWTRLIKNYLRGRVSLARVFLLIDSRHGIKKNDREIMTLLDETAVSYQIVLTKIDKISQKALEDVQQKILALIPQYTAAYPEIIATSSEKKQGLELLRFTISGLAR